jgi:Flp pilus assembly protein TadG
VKRRDRTHTPGRTTGETTTRRARDQRGAVAVEFAIIVPVLLLLVLGILEFGFGYHAWDATQNAAREGARLGAVSPDVAEIEARVRGTTSFLDQTKLTVTVECGLTGGTFAACSSNPNDWDEGDIVRVTVEYTYDFLTPLPAFTGMGSQMHMSSVSEARFEGI